MCSELETKLQKPFKEYLITGGGKRVDGPWPVQTDAQGKMRGCMERAAADVQGWVRRIGVPKISTQLKDTL